MSTNHPGKFEHYHYCEVHGTWIEISDSERKDYGLDCPICVKEMESKDAENSSS